MRWGAEKLNWSPTAMIDARVLLMHLTEFSEAEIILYADENVPEIIATNFGALIERRSRREPIAHIRGVQEFYLNEFIVTPDVLIPRPETEMLVERALALMPARVLDLGVGSGCILASILRERLNHGTDIYGEGWDISEAALAIAKRNLVKLQVDHSAALKLRSFEDPGDGAASFDLIVSNPPYIAIDAELPKSVKNFEPAAALFAGSDGLHAYRALGSTIRQLLVGTGTALLEIGTGQADAVTAIMTAAMPARPVVCATDLAGHERMVMIGPEKNG